MSEALERLRAALAGRYAIEREHGSGGMGTVYLALVGEPKRALDQLEPLLRMPYTLTPGWLRVDPLFDPVRKHPRFQRLVEGGG